MEGRFENSTSILSQCKGMSLTELYGGNSSVA